MEKEMNKLVLTIVVLLASMNFVRAETVEVEGKLIPINTNQEPSAEAKKLSEITAETQPQKN